jgi:hypothetical protein
MCVRAASAGELEVLHVEHGDAVGEATARERCHCSSPIDSFCSSHPQDAQPWSESGNAIPLSNAKELNCTLRGVPGKASILGRSSQQFITSAISLPSPETQGNENKRTARGLA